MKLIDLLVKELPKRGGWPERATHAWQDWDKEVRPGSKGFGFYTNELADNHRRRGECINPEPGDDNCVTRTQYESALAASEGWIEWGGGECPVHESANVDIKFEDGSEKSDVPACSFIWQHSEDITTIIAYRLHKPDINSRANDDRLEQDLNECIGQHVDMPEWNGDGLPPVGTVCMANLGNGWTDVKVAYIGDEGGWREALVFEIKSTKPAWADEFRPLRTEAEKALESAKHIIAELFRDSASNGHSADLIMEAIAAGKIPGVKLEVK